MNAVNQQGRLVHTFLVKHDYYQRLISMPIEQLGPYLAGFVDGEGCFSVSLSRSKFAKYGFFVNPIFQVYQHPNHREILEVFQWVFRTGRIRRKSPTNHGLVYCVDTNRNIRERIIPFFEKYRLSVKHADFIRFEKVLGLLEQKVHKTLDGMKQIVDIAYAMNAQGKQRPRTKSEVLSLITGVPEPPETTRRTSEITEDDIVHTSKRLED
jgi:hypothetical protein